MTAFGLPDNVCVCMDLKKGGKVIANVCIGASAISCLVLVIYLSSNFEEIAREIGDNNAEMVKKLNDNRACECLIILDCFVN